MGTMMSAAYTGIFLLIIEPDLDMTETKTRIRHSFFVAALVFLSMEYIEI